MARTSRTSGRGRRPSRPSLTGRGRAAIVALKGDAGGWFVLAAAVLAAGFLVPWMSARSHQQAHRPDEIRFLNTPAWVGESLLEHVGRIASRQCSDSTAPTQGDLAAMHDALERSGWFDQVRRVRWISGDAIEVDAAFLTPVTTVRDAYGDVVVDGAGRPLPDGTCMDQTGASIVLINPRHNRPGRALAAWRGDDVAAGLRLHELLVDHDWTHQVQKIDLAEFDRTGTLTLVTDLPSHIRWGAPPGEETPLETLADRKIHRLEASFRSHGRIDQHHTGEVDLTIASHLVHR